MVSPQAPSAIMPRATATLCGERTALPVLGAAARKRSAAKGDVLSVFKVMIAFWRYLRCSVNHLPMPGVYVPLLSEWIDLDSPS